MVHKIKGMPVKAIEKMLKSPRTPAHLREYWEGVMSGRSSGRSE